MELRLCIACLLFVSVTMVTSDPLMRLLGVEVCQEKPADVVFILDASTSISVKEFEKMKNFVSELIEMFDVSANMTRIAAMTYSNWVLPAFGLDDYDNKFDLKLAITRMHRAKGDTNTAEALKFARTNTFLAREGGRHGIPQIIVIITDGKSNNPYLTAQEASELNKQGVYIFAIGIGDKVDKQELEAIATKPADTYAFHVDTFDALSTIGKVLVIEACMATGAPPTLPPPTLPPIIDQACGDVNAADIVFAIAPSSSTENADMALQFYREFANQLEIADNKVRVGLVPKDCSAVPGLGLDDYEDKEAILAMLQDLEYDEDTPAKVLRHMRMVSFSPKHGARRNARRIGVLLVDESVQNFKHAKAEALKARQINKIELFVVGIGKKVPLHHMADLASKPVGRHVFQVDSYEKLKDYASVVRKAVCPFEYIPKL